MRLFEQIQALRFPAPLPDRLLEVRQVYDYPRVADVAGAVRAALEASGLLTIIQPGQSVAVGVGSRGIANLLAIVRAVIDRLKAHGAQPFIVAAMGSHGGATADGQRALLAELGITESSIGCPLRITWRCGRLAACLTGRRYIRIFTAPPLTTPSSSAGSSPTPTFAVSWRVGRARWQ